MSKVFANLINEFNKLSMEERTQFRDLIVHTNDDAELYGEVTDEDIEAMSLASFQRLDEEENAAKKE